MKTAAHRSTKQPFIASLKISTSCQMDDLYLMKLKLQEVELIQVENEQTSLSDILHISLSVPVCCFMGFRDYL